MEHESTIAAISTPPGEGGIGIVRLSGPSAFSIASSVFKPASNNFRIDNLPSHTVHYGHVVSGSRIVDEVLLTVMKAPRTYTREDIVEINCHGGIIPLRRTLALLVERGARPARPGEFTERAFLNGRIDLSQAEAVADIIGAKTDRAGEIASSHLHGSLRQKVEELSSITASLLASMEASIEFPDEDCTHMNNADLQGTIALLRRELRSLIATAGTGRILREGLKLVIAGLPNAGKSSIFNALLGENRMIVSPVPGTTRDIVEAEIDMDGIPLTLADTAGLDKRLTGAIEQEAARRSEAMAETADIILMVIDGTSGSIAGNLPLLKGLEHKAMLVAVNKSDMPAKISLATVSRAAGGNKHVLRTSAATGEGLDALRGHISSMAWNGAYAGRESIIISNSRHAAALNKAESALGELEESPGERWPEITALNLGLCLEALGEISGQTATEEILAEIFSRFCIGK